MWMQTIILISQIRVNSMAIVRMKSVDIHGPPDQFARFSSIGDAFTSSVEQVRAYAMVLPLPLFPCVQYQVRFL